MPFNKTRLIFCKKYTCMYLGKPRASAQIIDILSQKSKEDKLNEGGAKMRNSEYVIEKMKQQMLM